jgi:tetratricopeptide (TPR) repeat protein
MQHVDRFVLAGKLAGQLGHAADAVDILGEGLEHFPDDARLLRHRGHRYITLRRFEEARADLTRASSLVQGHQDEHEFYGAQIKDDFYRVLLDRTDQLKYTRVPVTSETVEATKHLYKATLHSSIHYHLALANYLLGQFEAALPSYEDTIASAVDDEMKVAASDWRYMALRRLGRTDEAAASLDSLTLTGGAFSDSHYFRRWRMYKGELDPSELIDPTNPDRVAVATQGYGVGNWFLYNGDERRAKEIFEMVTAAGSKDAFGFIASEVELLRMAAS